MITREALLAGIAGATEDVDLAAGTVRVRGLSRAEAYQVAEAGERPEDQEPILVSLGLAEPPMSLDDVRAWFKVAPAGDVQTLCAVITRLSGMEDGAGKVATKSVSGPRRRR